MLNQRTQTNHSSTEQTTIDSLIDDLLHHKRQNSEDSGLGDGISLSLVSILSMHHRHHSSLGRASINRTPDALSSMDCMDDPLAGNQAGRFTFEIRP